MKKISVITPTFARPAFLALARACFLSQTYANIEWLILDDSEKSIEAFDDPGNEEIRYFHSTKRLSIGEKRNRLIEKSTGEIIVNFDDDDYYAPNYIADMATALEEKNADLMNLRGFFLHQSRSRQYGYWQLMSKEGIHFEVAGNGIQPVMLNKQNNKAFANNHLGYGFGWIFKKRVWEKSPFADIDWNEDGEFALKAQENFKLDGIADKDGICLHFIHEKSTSKCFPQFLLPSPIMNKFFQSEKVDEYVQAGGWKS